jgi:hypothetical protein
LMKKMRSALRHSCLKPGAILCGLFVCCVFLAAISGCGRSSSGARRTEIRYCFFGGFQDWDMFRQMAAEFTGNPSTHRPCITKPASALSAKKPTCMGVSHRRHCGSS